jgi:hypothetical protein
MKRSSLAILSDTSKAKTKGQKMAVELRRNVTHFFPDFFDRLDAISDLRKRHDYTITEILLGGIFMFVTKQDSRNAMNLDRTEPLFMENYEKLFGKKLPHMDTVNDVLVLLSNEELEILKSSLVSTLITKKVLKKYCMLNGDYRVAVDATGVMKVNAGHCDSCLTKKSKNGVVSHFHNVLEAKLITPNGFCISLATEWIENEGDYKKQDCEQKAFKRLSVKLKGFYPRLPICILADGLYPNKPFFDICRKMSWNYIVTFKDGNLKTLWEDVDLELLSCKDLRVADRKITQTFRCLAGLSYSDHTLSWIECLEAVTDEETRFVYLSNLKVDRYNVREIAASGRLRFKIENEGFNTQKNLGYNLSHKFSRVSQNAMKNYVSLMQIGHLLNQLFELSSNVRLLVTGKVTIKYLWKRMISALLETSFCTVSIKAASEVRFQVRYE